ncbi:MAG TPA: DegQ family serine endoprotease [Thermodesulfovibrionales bacterium]|nr:DegQ family serine endoprotease [Thermodesulfovibrionales bacterium]
MKKNILIGIGVLLFGILIGGLVFYTLGKITGHHGAYLPYPISPDVPRQIIETSRAFSEIVSAVSPAVVNISTTKVLRRDTDSLLEEPFFDFFRPFHDLKIPKKWKEQSLGSGVVVSPDGYIITNNHVVEKSDEIKVTLLDKKTYRGRIVGADPKTDIAIVKIDASNLPTIPWGDSELLQVGEFVLAIGNPYGLSHTVTMGIISAVGRANVGVADYEDFIQTDAAINPGNSGGPLVNIKGELIGINTAIFSRTGGYQGIGFAVPSNMVRPIMSQLIQKGKIIRGWLGVTIQELTPELSQKFGLEKSKGALVSDIAKGSPADKAGIMRGDIILEFNGKEVKDVGNLRNMVAQSKVGSDVTIKILRSGKEYSVRLVIAELPREVAEVVPSNLPDDLEAGAFTGLNVISLTKEIAKQLGLTKDEKGVVVVRVEPLSPADEAGIKKGDVIKEVDKKQVENLEDFNRITSNLKRNETALLFITRGDKKFYVTLRAS